MYSHDKTEALAKLNHKYLNSQRENKLLKEALQQAHRDGFRMGLLFAGLFILLMAVVTITALGVPTLVYYARALIAGEI